MKHHQPLSFSAPGVCNKLYPVHDDPRIVAGGPLAGDILKCRLKPARAEDYDVAFSAAEWARLMAIFPDGVCDWSRRGVQQRALKDDWLAFPEPGTGVRLEKRSDKDDHRDQGDD